MARWLEGLGLDEYAASFADNAIEGMYCRTSQSLPVQIDRALRERSEQGFEAATDDLIVNLDGALAEFQSQAASGTVRGPGTPAVAMYDASGQPVKVKGGGGSLPLAEVLGAALLVSLALLSRRRGRS